MEPNARCSLQYDRLYVENEVYLLNEIEQKVERMLMNRGSVEGAGLITPRGLGPTHAGDRSSRMKKRSESRAGDNNENGNGKINEENYKDESFTEIEAELIQSCMITTKVYFF